MPETIGNLTVSGYLDTLASSEPAPGGGAVVALMGAQAAGLISMSLRISVQSEATLKQAATLDSARQRFLALADADAAAFTAVMDAYKLPTDSDSSKSKRKSALQDAFRQATQVPLQVMTELTALYDEADAVAAAVKATVASDVGVAAQLIHAALKASRYNLWINLKYIHDDSFKKAVTTQSKLIMTASKSRRDQLHRRVKSLIKTKT